MREYKPPTLLFFSDANGSVIQAPNRVPDVLTVIGPVIFINLPQAEKYTKKEIMTYADCFHLPGGSGDGLRNQFFFKGLSTHILSHAKQQFVQLL